MKPKEPIETIYESALGVFAEFGYKKATLEDIAGRLGMTKGNLYRYAKSKKALYRATVRHALIRWQQKVARAVAHEKDALAGFQVMCKKAVEYLSQDDDLRRLLIRDPDIFPMFPDNDPYGDINGESVGMVRRILSQGETEGVFRDVDLETAGDVIFSIYKMLIIRIYVHDPMGPGRRMFEQALELLTHGLLRSSDGDGT